MISEKSVMVYTFLHHAAWWCAHVPKVSANKAYRKNCLLEFPIAWTHIYIQKEGISKHFGKVWTVVTFGLNSGYLLNFEHGTEHDIDSAYGVCMH